MKTKVALLRVILGMYWNSIVLDISLYFRYTFSFLETYKSWQALIILHDVFFVVFQHYFWPSRIATHIFIKSLKQRGLHLCIYKYESSKLIILLNMMKYVIKLKPLKSKENQVDQEQTLANESEGRMAYDQRLQSVGGSLG